MITVAPAEQLPYTVSLPSLVTDGPLMVA